MATSNQERIGKGLELLAKALEGRIVKGFETAYGQGWWDVLDRQAVERTGKGVGTNYSDPYFQLTVMAAHWGQVFGKTLGKAERSYVGELLDIRNRWAHPRADRPFTSADTERALDTMSRLTTSIGAPDEAMALARMRAEILRTAWEAQTKQETKRQATLPIESVASPGVRPWREVIEPHPDVAKGRYAQAEFAADLGQVARGEGAPEYLDPHRFFERTFLTAGLSDLLVRSVQRLAGKPEGEPVYELQTNFGGGKTHSMLALFHLVSGTRPADLPGIEPILAKAGVEALPEVKRVVLVGTALSPAEPRRHDGLEARTLWGEMAWQLGGAAAYERLAQADQRGVSPGSDILLELLKEHGPALILIDEWVTFIRQLYTDSSLPAGSFDTNMTFAQSLTEAVKQSDRSLLVASLPSSDIEKGGEGGQIATERLKHVVGRVQSPWRPASPEEGFEIVRRRLFQEIPAELKPARDAVVQQFADLYARHSGEFPSDAKEAAYQRRMTECYPIHPELFEQLFGAWSTLERFQQTRGVLRLMAAVIHALWEREDRSPLILPASIPIDDDRVQSELTRYLEEQWVPVIQRDVDGEHSLPLSLDRDNPSTLGRHSAARRVARTIYLGSAPTANAATRGIDQQRIKLGCVMPGESPAVFGDALRRLADRATYLYDNAGRYWFSTQESVSQLARERGEQVRPDDVDEAIRERLRREQAERGLFARIHPAPRTSADVPDEDDVALVILGPEAPHSPRTDVSKAKEAATEILNQRGSGSTRANRNMLVFIAADVGKLASLEEATRQWLAWKSIDADKDTLTLDTFGQRQIEARLKETNETVSVRIPEAYQWLLVPTQPDPLGPITFEEARLSGPGFLAPRASTKLRSDGALITRFGGVSLRLELERHPDIWADGHVELRGLWELFRTYIYLPRLRDSSALLEAVRDGAGSTLLWRSETFAYAAGQDAAGRYLGLAAGRQFNPLLDGQSLIVKPEIAVAQMEADAAGAAGAEAGGGVGTGVGGATYPTAEPHAGTKGGTAENVQPGRFYGSISIDAGRPGPKFAAIATEVIAHLSALEGADVSVTVEIKANKPDGFLPETVRTVTENANQLKFDPGTGFEDS